MAVGDAWQRESGEWTCIRSTLDSGCVGHVAPPTLAPEVEIKESAGSRAGQQYSMANGAPVPNLGETTVRFVTADGGTGTQTYQMAQISRPLASVGKSCDERQRVAFGARGGFIYQLDTGRAIPFSRIGGLCELGQRLKKQDATDPAGFARQG